MGINFPSAPTVGDLYPTPAVAGVPQYKWDGQAWVTAQPNTQYVKLAGDTMSGTLEVRTVNPNVILNAQTFGGWPDVRFTRNSLDRWIMRANNTAESGSNVGSEFILYAMADAGGVASTAIIISRVDGRVQLVGDPLAPTHAANKQYVDAGVQAINAPNVTPYTFVLSDTGKLVLLWNATNSVMNITVPPQSAVPFAVGARIDLVVTMTNVATIIPGSGVTVLSEDSKRKLPKQGSCATLEKLGIDLWVLCGSLIA